MICMIQIYPIHIIMMNPIMLPHRFQILVIKMIGKHINFIICGFLAWIDISFFNVGNKKVLKHFNMSAICYNKKVWLKKV